MHPIHERLFWPKDMIFGFDKKIIAKKNAYFSIFFVDSESLNIFGSVNNKFLSKNSVNL